MLDLCKGCKCNAVCNYQTKLDELDGLINDSYGQNADIVGMISDGTVSYKTMYTCKHYLRIREKSRKKV